MKRQLLRGVKTAQRYKMGTTWLAEKKIIFYKTDEEIELIRESALLVCKTLAYAGSLLRPGITGKALDAAAEEFIGDHGGLPSFKGYRDYPATLTICFNEAVVHGIPSDREVQEDDVVSLDCGVFKNGFHGDAAYSFAMSKVGADVLKLMTITKQSLYKGIEKATHGNRVGDIAFAVQEWTEKKHGYGVVRDLVGHGVGKNLHEEPNVPNHGKRGNGVKLLSGMVIAIEPMINLGTKDVRLLADNWTIITADRKPSAHYEHTVAIRKGKADILSDHTIIEEIEKNNENLIEIPR